MRIVITVFALCLCTILGAQGLVINELVASNDSTSMISDEFGDFDDWVELYNNTNQAIDMSGYYFSDDYNEPDKWRFPAGITIPADGYLIVWTDSDNGQGDLHTSFKLSKAGEQLILSDSFLVVLDSLTFGEQETNVSFARIPNGTGNFTPRAPSFNANNNTSGVSIQTINVRTDFEVSPNPAAVNLQIDFTKTDGIFISEGATIQIIDLSGKLLFTKKVDTIAMSSIINLDINFLGSGIHLLKIQTGSDVFMKKFIVEKHD
jgi:lamin tail-like protein/type IX secretion system substrate protein